MHCIVPFAARLGAGTASVPQLLQSGRLPNLARLLPLLGAPQAQAGDEWSLSPPHERVLARALGLACEDGAVPTAAWAAARDGLNLDARPVAMLSPAHWRLGTEQISLLPPQSLNLDEAASREALAAIAPLFESEGGAVRWGAPLRWYVQHEALQGLRCASLERVIGRNIDRWLPANSSARLWRRLQNEVQMFLYNHPLNDAREAKGLLPLNSLWISGAGPSLAPAWPQDLLLADALVAPALAEDEAAWQAAWQSLDAGAIALALVRRRAGGGVRLTLCGERGSAEWWREGRTPWWQGLWQRASGSAAMKSNFEVWESL